MQSTNNQARRRIERKEEASFREEKKLVSIPFSKLKERCPTFYPSSISTHPFFTPSQALFFTHPAAPSGRSFVAHRARARRRFAVSLSRSSRTPSSSALSARGPSRPSSRILGPRAAAAGSLEKRPRDPSVTLPGVPRSHLETFRRQFASRRRGLSS